MNVYFQIGFWADNWSPWKMTYGPKLGNQEARKLGLVKSTKLGDYPSTSDHWTFLRNRTGQRSQQEENWNVMNPHGALG